MAKRMDVVSFTNNFAQNYVRNNPNASADEVRAALRDEMHAMKRNGARISSKEMALAQCNVDSAYASATKKPITLPSNVKTDIKTLNTNAAQDLY